MTKTRTCYECKKRKLVRYFKKDNRKPGGRGYVCKRCGCERTAKWQRENKVYRRQYSKNRFHKIRSEALKIVGRGTLKCRNCKCTRRDLLEINHMNGGGKAEFNKRGPRFYTDIVKKRRKISDLNILCKLCNILHYLKRRYGRLPYKISFGAKGIV